MDVIYLLIILIPGAYFVLKPIMYGSKRWPQEPEVDKEVLEKKDELINELKRLKELYESNKISKDEFEKLKRPVEEELLLLLRKYNIEI